MTIPTNGMVSMQGPEIGQPFNLSFKSQQVQSKSESKTRRGLCTYRTTEWQSINGILREVVVTRTGTEKVIYHTVTWKAMYDLGFSHYTNGELANLDAELDGAYDVDEWRGTCEEEHI